MVTFCRHAPYLHLLQTTSPPTCGLIIRTMSFYFQLLEYTPNGGHKIQGERRGEAMLIHGIEKKIVHQFLNFCNKISRDCCNRLFEWVRVPLRGLKGP